MDEAVLEVSLLDGGVRIRALAFLRFDSMVKIASIHSNFSIFTSSNLFLTSPFYFCNPGFSSEDEMVFTY